MPSADDIFTCSFGLAYTPMLYIDIVQTHILLNSFIKLLDKLRIAYLNMRDVETVRNQ